MGTSYESTPAWAGTGTPGTAVPPPAPARPLTLTLAFWGAVLVAVAQIAGAVVALLAGKESIRAFAEETVRDVLGDDVSPELLTSTIQAELDSAYNTLVIKAVVGIVVALLVLAFAVVARNGGKGARIGLAVALVLGLCGGSGLQLGDAAALPSATVAAAALSGLVSLVVIALLFLPPTNRYAAARAAAAAR